MFGAGAWRIVSNSPQLLRIFDRQTLVSSSDECLIPSSTKIPDSCLKSLLERLPLELLQAISSQLPLSSAAALALCSHHINYLLGDESWSTLRRQRSERIEFLKYLEQDFLDHYLCHACLRLHKVPTEDKLLAQSGPEESGREQNTGVA